MPPELHITFAGIISLAVFIAYCNYRFIKMPATVAIMAASLLISVFLFVAKAIGYGHIDSKLGELINSLDFRYILLHFMIGFLLFSGALSLDISQLRAKKWEIAVLATVSTLLSVFLVGTAIYFIISLLHLPLTYVQCLLFGALISPTDPIAVLAIFKNIRSMHDLATTIAAESLYNDGVGVVLFVTLYSIAFATTAPTVTGVLLLFAQQTLGGIVYGLLLGMLGCWLIKPIQDSKMAVLVTISLVMGGYTLAEHILNVSGLLAMVTSGIFIGNYRRDQLMCTTQRQYLYNFWEVIDELLNAVLFLMIGFEIVVIHASWQVIFTAIMAIPTILVVRWLTVALPLSMMRLWRTHIPFSIRILTWGGLRGGLAIALAFTIPKGDAQSIILPLTYAVVIFSILIQGSTIKPLIKAANNARLSRQG